MERLFVYGTLAPGRQNHSVVEKIQGHWEKATLRGHLVEDGWGAEFGCPGIVPSAEGEEVAGYVLSSINLAQYWSMLDEFEGSGYMRVPVKIVTEGGQRIEAYVYALNQTSD